MSFGSDGFEVDAVVDHYRLDRVVDQSGNITVFEAFDLRLLRRVALKELSPDVSADPGFRARFARDAARAAQLDHPGIASVYDSNDHCGSLYFVTKFVDGVSLAELARSRSLPVGEALTYLEQVAAALDYAHRRGVVHGSVGLGSVLVADDDHPGAVLFDVGITKRADGDGTPQAAWFPPATGEWSPAGPAAEPEARRVDLVGLARMAFELLTHKAPQDALASASMLEPALPADVDEVFAAVLGEADRDMTCSSFVAALRRALPPPPGSRLPPPDSALVADDPPAPDVEGNRRVLLVAGAVAAVLLVVGVLVWQGTRPTSAGRAGVAPATAVSIPTTRRAVAVTTTVPRPPAPSTAASTTRTATTAPPTTAAPTTAPPTTAPPTTVAPTTVTPTTVASPNPYGDVAGQPVTAPVSPQAVTAVGLEQRRLPTDVAVAETPAAYYAQWLRLTTSTPTAPVVATADGYAIDAGGPVELNQFQTTPDGGVVSFVECRNGMCESATAGVQLSDDCAPGPGCNAFATDDGQVLAVLRATVTLRVPAITLIFAVSSDVPLIAVNDPYNTVRWDDATGSMGLTLASAPPEGTQTSLTFTYADGTRSVMVITYG